MDLYGAVGAGKLPSNSQRASGRTEGRCRSRGRQMRALPGMVGEGETFVPGDAGGFSLAGLAGVWVFFMEDEERFGGESVTTAFREDLLKNDTKLPLGCVSHLTISHKNILDFGRFQLDRTRLPSATAALLPIVAP